MKLRNFIVCLVALFTSINASAETWTDANGTVWNFSTLSSSTAQLVRTGTSQPCISGTIPNELTIPSIVYIGETPYTITSIGYQAFYNCSSLTSITIPNSVTFIGSQAFSGCNNLTSINIPDGVTTIDSMAFNGCSNLTSVTIPSTVTSIRESAFGWCSNITSVHISDLAAWMNISFANNASNPLFCGHLYLNEIEITELVIPDGVTAIKDFAFRDWSALTSVTIPNSVTSIGGCAFMGCTNLHSINIPNSVTSIGGCAFEDCSGLSSITIPNSVMSIGGSAFRDCKSLSSITIPNSVTSIGGYAFSGCRELASLSIPVNVDNIGESAFGSHYMVVNFESTTPCTQNGLGTSVRLIVPHTALADYLEAWPVLSDVIVDANYSDQDIDVTANESASAVAIAIGEEYLRNVVSLKVSGTFNSYDLMVFRNKMTNLTNLDLSDANVVGNSYCYYESYYSKDNTITGNFVPAKICKLKLPKDIISIDPWGLTGCHQIKELTLPDGIASIPTGAISDMYLLSSIAIPSSVTSIGDYAFARCQTLSSISFPNNLLSIGDHAFDGCYNLAEVNLPSSVTNIGGNAFGGLPIKNIHLPLSLTTLGYQAFCYCRQLTEIHLPPYLTSIGNEAFKECNMLKDIYAYMPNIITIGTNTFNDYAHQNLYIPEFLYNGYYYDTNWSRFLNVYKTSLNPDDYEKVPTNSDIVFADGDERIPDKSDGDSVDGDLDTEGSFTVEGDEPQPFNNMDQNLDGEGQGGSLIGEGDTDATNNMPVNLLNVNITVQAGRWYFFCFPFDVTIANCEYPGQYAWRYYDGSIRALFGSGGWQDVTGETLNARQGYAFQSSVNGTLVVKFEHPTFGGERPEDLIAHICENAANASWNFLGNPYSSFYDFLEEDFTSPVTLWNGTSYTAYRPGDDECHLQPYEAFFVQKPDNTSEINFEPERRETYRQSQYKRTHRAMARRAQGINPERRLINLEILNGEEKIDRTRVVLNEKASREYEIECDAAKFLSTDAPAQIFSVEKGEMMAINERPQKGDIRLGYVAQKAGTLSISAPRMDMPMVLVDNKLGITFDLSIGAYEFTTDAGTFNDRFTLRESAEATAINTITAKTGVCIGKQDGGISIGGAEGKTISVYTTGGAQAAQHTGNGFISLGSGVYVVSVDGMSAKVRVK